MSELRTTAADVSKNAADVENYSKEFLELQEQLKQMKREKFNGVELFSQEGDNDGREVQFQGLNLTTQLRLLRPISTLIIQTLVVARINLIRNSDRLTPTPVEKLLTEA